MFRYTAKIRLGGAVTNEVRLSDLSAAEVMILRRLHGNDAVKELVETRSDRSQHADERMRLKLKYCGGGERRTRLNFEHMFGPEHMDLPNRLPDFVKKEAEEKARLEAEATGSRPPGMKSTTKPKNKFDVDASEVTLDAIAG